MHNILKSLTTLSLKSKCFFCIVKTKRFIWVDFHVENVFEGKYLSRAFDRCSIETIQTEAPWYKRINKILKKSFAESFK